MNPAPGTAAAKWSPAARRVARRACLITGAFMGAPAAALAVTEPLVTAAHVSAVVVALMLLVLGLVGAAALLWRSARQLRQRTDDLRRVRERLQCLDDLVDVWQWRTDSAHHLVWLRPPHGAAGAVWSDVWELEPRATAAGTALWDHFRPVDEAALRARLARHAPLDAIVVQHPSAGATPDGASHGGFHDEAARQDPSPSYRLHGRIRTDANGHFAGYQGVLHAVTGIATPAASVASDVASAAANPAANPAANDGAADARRAGFDSDHEAFSFTVSHDLRAPIRVVEGFTKIVKEDYGRLLDRVGNEHLDRVLGAAARMNNMIDALLALARLASQPLACQPVDLSALAAYVADDLRREWPDRPVTLDIAPGMRVQGDPTLLRVVLENLLGNAWKYSVRTAQPQISFGPQHDSVDVFTVRDNGAGFDMRFADRLFGVFQRLHSATDFPGSGVGLASVRRIVRRHGGDIWGEGEVGRGASFHFSLPQRAALPPRH